MRKVAKKLCKLSLFSQLSAPTKSGVTFINCRGCWKPEPLYPILVCNPRIPLPLFDKEALLFV